MKYLIKTKRNGENQVQVLKQIEKNNYSLQWAFALKKDSEPIILAEMYNIDCFIIANWNAWVRIYSISKKDIIFEKKFHAKTTSVVKISDDKTKLFISYYTPEYQPLLDIISLTDFSTLHSIVLPSEVKPKHFTLGKNDKVLFYYSNYGLNKHGYHVLNLSTEQVTYCPMKYPQWEKFEVSAPVISTLYNIGIMPLWNDVEVKKNESGDCTFILKVMLFDLDRFEIIKTIPIREFSVDHLGYYESTNNDMSEILQSQNIDDKDYKQAVSEFIRDNFNSIYFHDNKSFWVSFRGGIVRNVTFNGQLSPLFVTSSMPNKNGTGVFSFAYFHSYIDSIVENSIILREHDDYYRMTFSNDELKLNQEIIAKDITNHETITIVASQEDNIEIEEFNKVVINVSDLNLEHSYIEALDKIIELTTAIDEIKSGHLLQFKIKDNQRFEEDKLFFKNAIQIKGSTKKIAQIIKNFIAYKGADTLYYDDETTALAYAIYFLTAENEKYINLAIQYLSVIDFEHDVYNKEQLIPLLRDKYHEKHGQHIIKQLSKLNEGACWIEGYIN